MKSLIEAAREIVEGPNDQISLDIDFTYQGSWKTGLSKHRLKHKAQSNKQTIIITGKKKDILAYLQSKEYDMDKEDIKDIYPELFE